VAKWPNAGVCKTLIHRFKSDRRLHLLTWPTGPARVPFRFRRLAASSLQGTNLSLYGENAQLMGQLAPLFVFFTRSVAQVTRGSVEPAAVGADPR
jgi:hypothetical protein